MMRRTSIIITLILFTAFMGYAQDVQRFPPPDFESGYSFPETQHPQPKGMPLHYLDILILIGALSLAAYLVIKKRSRQGIFYLGIFSLIYFGFYREGCICPIGAIQNVSLAVFNGGYALPLVAGVFFVLPLLFTLFFGRVFCAGVCPLGAIQDLVLIKPIRVPMWLHHALGMLAYLYLGLAVMFAALGSAFIICQYDPFVSFFRFSGYWNIVLFGTALLVIGMFVGRPYCLYLCPYSILLKWFSRFSQWRVTVGPDEYACVKCESCENACPFNAITFPTPDEMPHPNEHDRKRLVTFFVIAPLIVVFSAWVFSLAGPWFSQSHFTVQLAQQVMYEDENQISPYSDESQAFRDSGASKDTLYENAASIQDQFIFAGWFLGAFMGLVLSAKLISLSMFHKREVYEADRAGCLGCGRCYCTCPLEKKRFRRIQAAKAAG